MTINGVPSYIQQNMAMIEDNIRSIIQDTASSVGGSKVDASGLYNSVFNDILSTFTESDFTPVIGTESKGYTVQSPGMTGTSGNIGASRIEEFMKAQNLSKLTSEKDASVKKAYDSLLNGDSASNLSSMMSSLETDKNSLIDKINKLKDKALNKNSSLITDDEFFDAKALTPVQINEILKKKNSPFANQVFNGKTVGQLIYDECQKAGTVAQGPHTINPALIISIMGAESGFGTDTKNHVGNPFNIRVNGSFSKVADLPSSLNMAVNTMYNWAMDRPKDSKVSFFDFAGNKYCENYTEKWKPNVEKYFLEFTLTDTLSKLQANKGDKNINSLLSTMGNMSGGPMNMSNLMNMIQGNNSNDPLSKANLLTSLTPNSMLGTNKEE